MSDPRIGNHLSPVGPTAAPGATRSPARPQGGADDFASLIKEQLQKVSEMQNEAQENVEKLLTGQTENVTEVFTAARKAEVAFSLLMEIRNKLVDAYEEFKNMRV